MSIPKPISDCWKECKENVKKEARMSKQYAALAVAVSILAVYVGWRYPATWLHWLNASVISVGGGTLSAALVLCLLRSSVNIAQRDPQQTFSPVVVGMFEQLAFMMFVAHSLQGVGALMGAWIVAKTTIAWLPPHAKALQEMSEPKVVLRAYTAAVATLVSLLLASIGGQYLRQMVIDP